MKVLQSGVFTRTVKRLNKKEKKALDNAIKTIITSPDIGSIRTDDLVGARILKYKVSEKQYLLGYRYDNEVIVLTLLALHY